MRRPPPPPPPDTPDLHPTPRLRATMLSTVPPLTPRALRCPPTPQDSLPSLDALGGYVRPRTPTPITHELPPVRLECTEPATEPGQVATRQGAPVPKSSTATEPHPPHAALPEPPPPHPSPPAGTPHRHASRTLSPLRVPRGARWSRARRRPAAARAHPPLSVRLLPTREPPGQPGLMPPHPRPLPSTGRWKNARLPLPITSHRDEHAAGLGVVHAREKIALRDPRPTAAYIARSACAALRLCTP